MLKKNFDTYIQYYRPTRTADSYGQVIESWAEYQKAFVNVEKYTGDEDVQSERLVHTNITTITGHYISVIDTTFRVYMDSIWYNILDIEVMERKRWMRLVLEKVND